MCWIPEHLGPPDIKYDSTQGPKLHPKQWRYNEGDCVSNHQRLDCLLNRLFRRTSKKHFHSIQWYFNRSSYIFIQEKAFEKVVRKMAAILSRSQCVKSYFSLTQNMDLLFTNICCHSNGYAYHDDWLREFPHTFVPISVSNISFIIWIFIRRWANMTSGQIMVKSHVHVNW